MAQEKSTFSWELILCSRAPLEVVLMSKNQLSAAGQPNEQYENNKNNKIKTYWRMGDIS